MHAAAKNRAVSTRARHRAPGGRHRADRLTVAFPATAPDSMAGTYARYVGRIGALAVALGIGAAVATSGAGLARADDTTSDSSDSASQPSASDASSDGGQTSTDSTTAGDAPSSSSSESTTTDSGQPNVLDMNFSSSGGAHTAGAEPESDTEGDEVLETGPTTDAAEHSAPDPEERPKNDSNHSAPTPTTPHQATAHEDAPVVDHDPVPATTESADDTHVAQPVSVTISTPEPVVATEPTPPVADQPPAVATLLAAAIAPFVLPGPATPAASPLLWAVLAWTRREADEAADADPVALPPDITVTTAEDTPLSGTLPTGGALIYELVDPPRLGTVVADADGTYVYTPRTDSYGADVFTYTVSNGTSTSTYTVAVDVVAVNDAPYVTDTTATTRHDVPVDIGAYFYDYDSPAFTGPVIGQPANGTVTYSYATGFTYTPRAGFVGDDSFTYTVTDSSGLASTGTVGVSVLNDAPTATNDSYVTVRDVPLDVDAEHGLLAGEFDTDGDPFTVVSFTQTSNGTLVVYADGSFTYTPDSGYIGFDHFEYTVADDLGAERTTFVNLYVDTPPNRAPVAKDDGYEAEESTAAHGYTDLDLTPLLNDTDADGDELRIVGVGEAKSGGIAQLTENNVILYTPPIGFTGTDTITYQVSDGRDTVEATITVTVLPSTAPTARPDSATVVHGGTVTIDALANDSNPRKDDLVISVVSGPSHGTVEYDSKTGVFTYHSDGTNAIGDSFWYGITDESGRTSEAEVSITFTRPDLPPTANDDWASTPIGEVVAIDVLDNDYDREDPRLTVTVGKQPASGGKAVVQKDGTIVFTPDAGYQGFVQFDYTVTDRAGNVATATVSISVYDPTPIELDKQYTVGKNKTITVSASLGLLSNTQYAEYGKARLYVKPSHGTVRINLDGSFTYTPNQGFVGEDSFEFSLDGGEFGDGATATIRVTPDGPGAEANYATTVAMDSDSAYGSCGSSWLLGQSGPGDLWPTCLFVEGGRRSDL